MTFAFVFPGQGSQSVGMLNTIADRPEVRATLQEASEALGEDITKLIAEGPAEALSLTTNTQPVMLTAAIAFYRAWLASGGAVPQMMAGHSLGEYSALVAAGVIAFKDAVPLVRFRAEAMQTAVPVGTGGMAAILGLDDAIVKTVCAEAAAACGGSCCGLRRGLLRAAAAEAAAGCDMLTHMLQHCSESHAAALQRMARSSNDVFQSMRLRF